MVACETGKVVAIVWFTGRNAFSSDGVTTADWYEIRFLVLLLLLLLNFTNRWNDTKAILIEGNSGVIVYGEIDPNAIFCSVGNIVTAGSIIGEINVPVLRSFKGRPMVMLHLELMLHGSVEPVWWMINHPKPDLLCDPTPHLIQCSPDAKIFDLHLYDGTSFMDPNATRKDSPYWKVWNSSY